MKTNPNEGIHPFLIKVGEIVQSSDGLTKREYFAALAMQGFCQSADWCSNDDEECARVSIKQADALIIELNKEK